MILQKLEILLRYLAAWVLSFFFLAGIAAIFEKSLLVKVAGVIMAFASVFLARRIWKYRKK